MRFILLSFFVIFCNSCLFSQSQAGQKRQATEPKVWPEEMRRFLLESKYDMAWGLFSRSGFSNRGQVMIYGSENGKSFLAQYVVPDEKTKISKSEILKGSQLTDLKPVLKEAQSLGSYEEPSFDGMSYSYLVLRKDNDKVDQKQKITIINPPKATKHHKLVEAIYGLFE